MGLFVDSSGGAPDIVQPAATPDIPRGGPHELGSKLPHTPGEDGK
jgi:hypothetical protein